MSVLKELINADSSLSQGVSKVNAKAKVVAISRVEVHTTPHSKVNADPFACQAIAEHYLQIFEDVVGVDITPHLFAVNVLPNTDKGLFALVFKCLRVKDTFEFPKVTKQQHGEIAKMLEGWGYFKNGTNSPFGVKRFRTDVNSQSDVPVFTITFW